jgi:hypothetical protein
MLYCSGDVDRWQDLAHLSYSVAAEIACDKLRITGDGSIAAAKRSARNFLVAAGIHGLAD